MANSWANASVSLAAGMKIARCPATEGAHKLARLRAGKWTKSPTPSIERNKHWGVPVDALTLDFGLDPISRRPPVLYPAWAQYLLSPYDHIFSQFGHGFGVDIDLVYRYEEQRNGQILS